MSPNVVIYNPKILPASLVRQVARFGLLTRDNQPHLSGRLKGSKRALIEMIHTYGVAVEVVPATI